MRWLLLAVLLVAGCGRTRPTIDDVVQHQERFKLIQGIGIELDGYRQAVDLALQHEMSDTVRQILANAVITDRAVGFGLSRGLDVSRVRYEPRDSIALLWPIEKAGDR